MSVATALQTDVDAAIEFLRTYRPGGPWVLTAIPGGDGRTATALFTDDRVDGMRGWIESCSVSHNVYFHVNSGRRDSYGKKLDKADVGSVEYLHVDVDPPEGVADDAWRAKKLRELREHVPPPTLIVFSGGGYGAFWRLAEPIAIPDPIPDRSGKPTSEAWRQAVESIESRNVALAEALGGDHCHDVSRLMRLPGTVNRPNAKKLAKGRTEVLAEVVDSGADSYELDVFPRAETSAGTGSSGAVYVVDLPADLPALNDVRDLDGLVSGIEVDGLVKRAIEHGDYEKFGDDRSRAVFFVACSLVRRHIPDDVIASVLLDPKFEISAHARSKKDSRRAAGRAIAAAHERVGSGAPPEEDAEVEDEEPENAFDVTPNLGTPTEIRDEVDEINQEYFLIERRGRVGYFKDGQLRYMQFDHFKTAKNNRKVEILVPGKNDVPTPKKVPLGDHWMKNDRRREYVDVEFKPGRRASKGHLNPWHGWPVTPDASTDADELRARCARFLAHIEVNLCRGRQVEFDYVLSYVAHALQRPWEAPHTVIVLQAVEGFGKGIFNTCVGSLFGPHYVPIHDAQALTGEFNAHLEQAIWVFADEAFFAGNRKDADKLKSLTGGDEILIQPKGIDRRPVRRYFRTCMASNHKHVIQAAREDRRHLVLEGRLDLDALNARFDERWESGPDFFEAVMEEWKAGGREAFAAMMRDRDVSRRRFNPYVRPETEELQQQRMLSLSGINKVVLKRLESGDLTLLAQREGDEGREYFVETHDFTKDESLLQDTGTFFKACGFKKDRRKLAASVDEDKKPRVSGWWIPRLARARAAFAEAVGIPIDWSGGPTEWLEADDVL